MLLFKAGDVVIRVGKKTVDAVEKIQRELQKYDKGDLVEFEVVRKNGRQTFKVELEEQQCMGNNFIIPKPHIFQTDPFFDDIEIHLDLDEPQVELNKIN